GGRRAAPIWSVACAQGVRDEKIAGSGLSSACISVGRGPARIYGCVLPIVGYGRDIGHIGICVDILEDRAPDTGSSSTTPTANSSRTAAVRSPSGLCSSNFIPRSCMRNGTPSERGGGERGRDESVHDRGIRAGGAGGRDVRLGRGLEGDVQRCERPGFYKHWRESLRCCDACAPKKKPTEMEREPHPRFSFSLSFTSFPSRSLIGSASPALPLRPGLATPLRFASRLDSFGVKLCERVCTCPGNMPPSRTSQ
ncbi:hypothetical protein B0H13DRAFT_2156406, partial [Mycena leptocephala]